MSDAAIEHVRACAHPKVKGSVRAFFDAVARSIPEGQTTTPPLKLEDLAAGAQQVDRTARKNRDFLEGIGELKVHDGGRGRKDARYEIVRLTSGARPMVPAPLPLRADLRPVTPSRPTPEPPAPDLLTSIDESASGETVERSDPTLDPAKGQWRTSDLFADVWQKVGSFCRRWWAKVGSDVQKVGNLIRPLRVLTTARDVHTFKNVHTHTPAAPRDGPHEVDGLASPPRPLVHPWHSWCGLVCVPKALHQEFIRKRHDPTWLLTFYARTCDTLPPDERITVNDYTFWRTALKAENAARASGPVAARRPDIPIDRPCPHQPPCADTDACVDRMMADWLADKGRKSG